MKPLATLRQEQLDRWIKKAKEQAKMGKLPNYIPLLHQANPNWLAVYPIALDGQTYSFGDTEQTFPLMSGIKPFLLLYLLSHLGTEAVFKRIGREPSEYPFYSLEQLQGDRGFPRNPMINSGAITLASLLPGEDALSRCENLRNWLNQCGDCQLFLSEPMLQSVRSVPNIRNQLLSRQLASRGYLEDPEMALDTYNRLCCLSGTIIDLARLGLLLVRDSPSLPVEYRDLVREIMTTCGLYEVSAEFAQKVGLPTKSGVSGVVLSLVPNQGAIACYSPPLDELGNSVAGLFLVEQIAKYLNNK
jgi:glutaminase